MKMTGLARGSRVVALYLGLAVTVIVVYSGVLSLPFQYDDFHSIVENPHVRTLSNVPDFFSSPELFSEDPRNAMFRPLVLVSYAIDYQLYGYDSGAFHWINLLLHVAATCLVASLALMVTGSLGGGLVAGLVFGLHPVNTEAVAYVSSRSGSMCAVFFVVAFYTYLRAGTTLHPHLWTAFSLLAYVAALMSKAVGVTLPVVLVLYEVARSRGGVSERFRFVWRDQWPYLIVTLFYLLVVHQLLRQAVVDAPVRGLATQLWTQAKGLTYYLKLLAVPHPLSVEHQFNLGTQLTEYSVIGGLALLLSTVGLLWAFGRRDADRLGMFWMTWPFVTLLPTLLVPLNVLVNEHRLYLPSMAVAMMAAALFTRYRRAHPVLAGSMVALLAVSFALQDTARIDVWQSRESLWSDAAGKAPGMPRPHIYLGDDLKEKSRHEEALRSYNTALRIHPSVLTGMDQVVIYNNIGSTLLAMGRSNEAILAYRTALGFDSTYVKSREALEGLLAFQPKKGEHAQYLHKQGLLALWNGQLALAISCLQGALAIERSAGTLMALGTAYERDGDIGKAIGVYREIAKDFGEEMFAATAARKADSLSSLGTERND